MDQPLRFGDVEVWVVNDGYWRMDGGAMFGVVPRVLWERRLPADERHRVAMAQRCLLIRSGGATVVVDTGLGDKLGEKDRDIFGVDRPLGLLGELAQLGIGPGDVDVVVNTHLHFDHAGGNTMRRADALVPTFPRAEYWVRREEWEDASHPNERTRVTYVAENFLPLAEDKRVRWFEGEIEVAPGVWWLLTPGHTRGHTSVVIESEGSSAVFPVDVCPFVPHLERLAWVSALDLEPLVAMETKRRLVADILAHDRLVIFDHDPNVAAGRLRNDGDRVVVDPVTL